MDESERQAIETALDLFNQIRPDRICAFHQASFRVASSYLSEQFTKYVLKNVLQMEVKPERLEEMLDKIVVHPFVQGTRLYASQSYAQDFEAPSEPQVPFEWLWRSYTMIEQDEKSEPAKMFEEACAGLPSLMPLAGILAYTFTNSSIEDFPELAGKEEKLHQILAVYLMAGVRFEFLYLTLIPDLTKAIENLRKEEEGKGL
jgi:hypothetical protein